LGHFFGALVLPENDEFVEVSAKIAAERFAVYSDAPQSKTDVKIGSPLIRFSIFGPHLPPL